MSQEKILREITLKRLEKETFINFSEGSINILNKAIDDYIDNTENKPENIVKELPMTEKSRGIIKRGLEIYIEERTK